jgi:signal transduction histidine kinase
MMNDEQSTAPGEFGQSILRLAVIFIGCCYLGVAYQYGWFRELKGIFTVVGLYFLGAATLAILARYRPSGSRLRRLSSIALDQIFIPAMVGQSGAILAPFVGGPAFISVGNGLRFGPGWAYLSGTAGAISLSVVMFLTPFWREIPLVSAGIVIATFALPVYAARLSLYLTRKKVQMERRALDMEERVHEAQQLLRERQNELAHMARLNSTAEIAMGIAHEINQPLAAILSYNQACIRMLRQAAPDLPEISRAMEGSVAQARRSGAIISKLRSFINKHDLKTVEIDLSSVALDALALVRYGVKKNTVAIRTDMALVPLPIHADEVQIQQVIVNIVRNALDALGEHGGTAPTVWVSSHLRGASGIIEIADNGAGFDEATLAKVFYPFFTTKAQGMGLGLTISQTIVESFGGTISADNRPEGGAIFKITFPLPVGKTSS